MIHDPLMIFLASLEYVQLLIACAHLCRLYLLFLHVLACHRYRFLLALLLPLHGIAWSS